MFNQMLIPELNDEMAISPVDKLTRKKRSADEKRKIILEDEEHGLAPFYQTREMSYQFNKEHIPYASAQSQGDLSRPGIGTAKDLLSYQPNSQATPKATDVIPSTLLSSNGETTKLYQWGEWGAEALLDSGYVPQVVKDAIKAAKDKFDDL